MQAFDVAERLRRAVEHVEISLEFGLALHVTVSIRVTSREDTNANIDTMLSWVGKALHEAKTLWRNVVCIFKIRRPNQVEQK